MYFLILSNADGTVLVPLEMFNLIDYFLSYNLSNKPIHMQKQMPITVHAY